MQSEPGSVCLTAPVTWRATPVVHVSELSKGILLNHQHSIAASSPKKDQNQRLLGNTLMAVFIVYLVLASTPSKYTMEYTTPSTLTPPGAEFTPRRYPRL